MGSGKVSSARLANVKPSGRSLQSEMGIVARICCLKDRSVNGHAVASPNVCLARLEEDDYLQSFGHEFIKQ